MSQIKSPEGRSSLPWVIKHRPKTITEIAGNKEALQQLLSWIKGWSAASRQKAVLLYGPPGTGKTSSVESMTRDLNLDLVEVNASDSRARESLERKVVGASSQGELFGRKRLILLDEIDGIDPTEDRGAIDAIVRMIGGTRFPIILTANDAWDRRIAPIRELCLLIQFKRIGLREAIPYLRNLCSKEGVDAEEGAIRLAVDRNKGDMRSMVNDLQAFSLGRKRLTYEDMSSMSWRDRKDTVFDALRTIFAAQNVAWARRAVDASDVDYEMLFQWIVENVPNQLVDPEDLDRAFEALAKADLYMARIKRHQTWNLLPFYLELMTAGVALSRQKGKPNWTPMKFPERVRVLARTRKARNLRQAIGQRIASRCHISSRRAARHFLPYLAFIFQRDKEKAAEIAQWLQLDREMIVHLSTA